MSAKFFPLLMFVFLAACTAHENNWQPTIDTGNDAYIDQLHADLAACKHLAEKAGEQAWTIKSRSAMTTDDGTLINGSEFRRAYIKCMKERRHPVIE